MERDLVQRGRYEVHQRERVHFVRGLFTDANKSLIALVARSERIEDSEDKGHLTIFYVPGQPVRLSVSDELSNNSVQEVQQGAVLDEKAAAADGIDHAFKEDVRFSGGLRLIQHPQVEDHLLFVTNAIFPGPQLQTIHSRQACSVGRGVVEGYAYCVTMEVVDEIERHPQLSGND